jgi:hypothetical protein
MSSTKENMYPFTIYHANSSIPRRHTLYARTPTARTNWYNALVNAIGVRKARQDANKVFALPHQSSTCLIIKTSGMDHKRLTTASSACLRAPHLPQGCILLVVSFVPLTFVGLLALFCRSTLMGRTAFQKRNLLAAGCTNGIYVGIRTDSCKRLYISLTLVTDLRDYSISEGLGTHQPNLNSCRPRNQQVHCPLRHGVILLSS